MEKKNQYQCVRKNRVKKMVTLLGALERMKMIYEI